jgi:hypothetical protein
MTIAGGTGINLTAAAGDVIIPVNIGLVLGDGGEKIESDNTNLTVTSGGKITLDATTAVELNSAAGDIVLQDGGTDQLKFDLDGVVGEIVISPQVASDDLVFNNQGGQEIIRLSDTRGKVFFFDEGGEYIQSDGSTMTVASGVGLNLTPASGDVTIPVNIGLVLGDGGEKIESDNTDLTVTSGGKITLDATTEAEINSAAGDIRFQDGGVDGLAFDLDGTAGEVIIKAMVASDDTVFQNQAGQEQIRLSDTRGKMFLYDEGGEYLQSDGSGLVVAGGAVTIDSAATIILDSDNGNISLKDGGTAFGGISSSATYMAIASLEQMILSSSEGQFAFYDDGTNFLNFYQSSGNCIISSSIEEKDIIFHGDIGAEVFRVDGSAGSLQVEGAGGLVVKEISAPGTPASGYGVIYATSANKVFFKADDGTATDLTSGIPAADDITSGDAAVSIDTSSGNITIDSNAGLVTIDGHTGVTIQSTDSGNISIDSVAELHLNSTTGDIKFQDGGTDQLALDMDGTAGEVIIKAMVASDDLVFQNQAGQEQIRLSDTRGKMFLYDEGGEYIQSDGSAMTIAGGTGINLTAAAGDVIIPVNIGLVLGDGGEKIESDNTDLTVTSGGDIVLDATTAVELNSASGDVIFQDGGTDQLALDMDGTAGEVIMQLKVASDDFVFKTQGGTEVFKVQDGGSFDIAGGLGSSGVTVSAAGALSADGRIITDDATEATTTTDGSLQTDGGLSVALSAVIGDDLDLLSNLAVFKVGSDQPFTLTHANASNALVASADHRLAFGDPGEYIAGDGTDMKIMSSGDVDITATLVDVTGAGSFSGNLTVGGNLDVNGTVTTIDTTNTQIQDSIIGLGVSGSAAFDNSGDRGLIFARGAAAYSALPGFWWDGTYFNLATSVTSPASGTFGPVTTYNTLKLNQVGLDNNADADFSLFLDWNEDEDSADRTLAIKVGGGNRTLELNESLAIGDGHDGTLTFSAASKVLTVEDTSAVNQDLTTDATPVFAGTINSAHVALTSSVGLKQGQKLILDDDHDTYGVSSGDDLFGFLAGGKAIFSISGSTGNYSTKFHRDALPLGGHSSKVKLGDETHPWRALYLSGNDGDNQGRGHALISAGGGGTAGGANSAHDLMITAGSGSNAIYLSGTDSTAVYGGISFHTDDAETLPIGSLFLSLADEYGSFMSAYHVRSGDSRPTSLIAAVTSASLGQRKGRYVVTSSHTLRRTLDVVDAAFNNAPYGGHQFLNDDYLDVFVNGQLMYSGTDAQLGLGTADYALSTGSNGAVIPASGLSFGFTLESDDVIQVIRRAP